MLHDTQNVDLTLSDLFERNVEGIVAGSGRGRYAWEEDKAPSRVSCANAVLITLPKGQQLQDKCTFALGILHVN